MVLLEKQVHLQKEVGEYAEVRVRRKRTEVRYGRRSEGRVMVWMLVLG